MKEPLDTARDIGHAINSETRNSRLWEQFRLKNPAPAEVLEPGAELSSSAKLKVGWGVAHCAFSTTRTYAVNRL
jgi:hypothetical protein